MLILEWERKLKMLSLEGVDIEVTKVLLRRISIRRSMRNLRNCDDEGSKNIPVIQMLLEGGASVAIIAHQGDTLDYQNLTDLSKHAQKISEYLHHPVEYLDDVCGPAAVQRVKALKPGEIVILGNLRYLTEEVSTFERDV